MKKILFVCTGNICRSPTADGVLRQLIKAQGLAAKITVDSAGLESYHVGQAPDHRACKVAAQRAYTLSDLRARQVNAQDFAHFDLILAMDKGHFASLTRLCPPQYASRIALFMDYAQTFSAVREVPDPYYGNQADFEYVLDLIEDACAVLLQALSAAAKG